MFESCDNCRQRVLHSRRTPKGVFRSAECEDFHTYPTFCDACLGGTLDETAGSMTTVNGTGTQFLWDSAECPACRSKIRHTFFFLFWLPLVPTGRFRVKYCTPRQYLSRRLRPGSAEDKRESRLYYWFYSIIAGTLLLLLLLWSLEKDPSRKPQFHSNKPGAPAAVLPPSALPV